jgi:hypothetical protein
MCPVTSYRLEIALESQNEATQTQPSDKYTNTGP